ncbi:MAG: RNA polymerase sigma factor SigZ [Phycisphaerales bacterium]|nr:RNA polymerase sigma factor SigZ [Phycisphaerae bacterium]NNF43031.1 RNA polymerase sigma factor SigZ [Phycisphaerales bacterium]NNM25610.1 RNA polymerase sigma factor SigZ [Phycisphaerales bacterium]
MTPPTEHVWSLMGRDLAAFIRRRVRDEHAAADILQETFLRIHNGIATLRDEERLAGWVYRIARNAISEHVRGARSVTTLDDEAAADAADGGDNHNDAVGRWLKEMIGSLPPDYRVAMELAEGDGVPQRVVAERLGLSPSGAKSRIQRGRAMLRAMLAECCHLELDRFGNVIGYARNRGCAVCCRDAGRPAGS